MQPPQQMIQQYPQQVNQQNMMILPSTNAVTALVLSIIGIIGSLFYGLGIVFAIPGLVLANGALRITNQFPNHPDSGLAKAAQVCGWIGIGLASAFILLVVLAGVLYVWASSIAA